MFDLCSSLYKRNVKHSLLKLLNPVSGSREIRRNGKKSVFLARGICLELFFSNNVPVHRYHKILYVATLNSVRDTEL